MLITALVMGFAGSLHCVGMCSPLALAITNMSSSALLNRLVYNAGRIFTYGTLGVVAASFGAILHIEKLQNLLSIALGLVMLAIGIAGISTFRIPVFSSQINRLISVLKTLFTRFIQKKNIFSMLLLGALNGLLPCGLTFLALTFCMTLSSPLEGFYYMLLFGAGTLPVMMGLASVIQLLMTRFRINMKKATTGMIILSGMLLIARVFMMQIPAGHSIEEHVVDIVLCR